MAAVLDFQPEKKIAIFDLQVSQILPTKFRVKWPFASGEEMQNKSPR